MRDAKEQPPQQQARHKRARCEQGTQRYPPGLKPVCRQDEGIEDDDRARRPDGCQFGRSTRRPHAHVDGDGSNQDAAGKDYLSRPRRLSDEEAHNGRSDDDQ